MRISSPRFIGREDELGQLQAGFDGSRLGKPAVVLVGAEAGVGKTRLLHEHLNRCRASGATVMLGGCIELGTGAVPLAPITEALRNLAHHLGEARVRSLLTGPRRWLTHLIPELVPAKADVEDAPPAQLFGALARLLSDLAGSGPVVLALEDLHWADRSTLDLLTYLARTLHEGQITVVGTFRTDELHRRHILRPVLAELGRLPILERIALEPFSPVEIEQQLTGILGTPPAGKTLATIVERSGGNAFFAEELVAAQGPDGSLPANLRDILAVRLSQLSDQARTVLGEAAIVGQRFNQRLLEQVSAVDDAVLRTALREAIDASVLIVDAEMLGFRHALLQEAVRDDVLPADRVSIHAKVAATLTSEPGLAVGGRTAAAGAIAHHWWSAHDVDRAFTASIEAAKVARSMYAHAEAWQHGEHALELWDSVRSEARDSAVSKVELLLWTAQGARWAGDEARALQLGWAALAAADASDGEQQIRAYTDLAQTLWTAGRANDGLEVTRQAVMAAGESPSRSLAKALRSNGNLLALLGHKDEAVPVLRRALEMARVVDARDIEARALHSLAAALDLEDLDEAVSAYESAIAIHRELGEVTDVVHASANLGSTLLVSGHALRAVGAEQQALEYAESHGMVGGVVDFACLTLAAAQHRLGRWADAAKTLERLPATQSFVMSTIHHAAVAGALALGQGRLDEARRLMDEADPLLHDDLDPEFRIVLMAVGAEVLRAEGHPAAALARVEPLVGEQLFDEQARLLALAVDLAADIARTTRHGDGTDSVRSLDERAARWVTDLERGLAALPERSGARVAGPLSLARAHAALTRLRSEPDPDAWARAIDLAVSMGERPAEAELRYRRAEALIERDAGSSGAAVEELARALDIADEMGAPPLRHAVEGLARRARIHLPGSAAATAPGTPLTPREHDVLSVVAAGLSNQEVGERLFISPKTVSVHMSSIIRKLGVSNRLEAVTAAHRLGIVDLDA